MENIMINRIIRKRIVVATFAAAVWMMPVAALAQQTQIKMPKNKYSVQTDVTEGMKIQEMTTHCS